VLRASLMDIILHVFVGHIAVCGEGGCLVLFVYSFWLRCMIR
jgi:hypothetical protein